MIVDQISVFIENKLGTLAEVAELIGGAGIDLRALSLADTTDFGVLRLIVSDPGHAFGLLQSAGFAALMTQTLAVPISDSPGGLAKILRIMADEKIIVEYAYAFITRREGKAYVILRVEDNERARDALASRGIEMPNGGNIFDQ